jgi:DNA-binding winged helix-turn-helix (wHTH) protein
MSTPVRDFLKFGSFKVDPVERVLLRNNQPVALTQKVFDLLLLLVQNSGQVVEKERLMREIWPNSFVEEGNLTQNISVLRKVLNPLSPVEAMELLLDKLKLTKTNKDFLNQMNQLT